MNYYDEIKNKLIDNEIYAKIKDNSKERNRVATYYEIGKLLNEAGKKYGDDIIGKFSKKLVIEVDRKYNKRTLFRIKQFYTIFKNIKVSPMATQLSWSHYSELLSLKDKNEILYYISVAVEMKLSKRELREKVKNNEYNRLSANFKNKFINNVSVEVNELLPNPILVKNPNKINIFKEKTLHQLIHENIESFMKELGIGYSFIDSEYKIKIGDSYHRIDFLLFNIKFNSYVVVELKVTEFKVEYISQVQKYMNYIDKNVKEETNSNTIGIIICKRENKFVLEYCSDDRIAVREYELV